MLLNIDIAILQWIQEILRNSFLDRIMPMITVLGDKGVIWIFIAIILLIMPPFRKVGIMILVTLLLGAILGEIIIKPFIGRERPFTHMIDFILLIEEPTSFSFPSGHTASSFGAATIIGKNIKKLKVPTLFLATAIAFSRMYLYVHYPSDILGGVLLGGMSAHIIHYFFQKNKKRL